MSMRAAQANPRAALLSALLFIVLCTGLYIVSPWLLPIRIIEGPLVQQTGQNAATLIWYTTRAIEPEECQLTISDESGERILDIQTDGTRNRVRIDGLSAGRNYPYSIRLGSRTLTEATIHTAKMTDQPYAFIVFGDSGRGTREQYTLATQMRAPGLSPDFILHVGDLIYSQGKRSRFKDRFFTPYRHLLAEINFWPSLGNHEIDDSGECSAYLKVFELPENGPVDLPPERNYWFDYASARIAVIDSTNNTNEAVLQGHLVPWLEEIFSSCDATWKFVALHHPPYTAGAYQPDLTIQRTLVPMFESVGVDIVFSGHDHMYQRTHPLCGGEVVENGEGVVYIVTGAGGAGLYDALPPERRPANLASLENTRHSFTYVQIDGHELRLQQIDSDGEVIDEWALTKNQVPSAQP